MTREKSLRQVRADVREVLGYFPLSAIEHLLANRHRLIRRVYRHQEKGCFFNLLSETLPREFYINSKPALVRFFTGNAEFLRCESPEYQAPRWLVRLIDGHVCPRYGSLSYIDYDFLLKCVEEVAQERRAREAEAMKHEQRALARLEARRLKSTRNAETSEVEASFEECEEQLSALLEEAFAASDQG